MRGAVVYHWILVICFLNINSYESNICVMFLEYYTAFEIYIPTSTHTHGRGRFRDNDL